MDYIDASKFIYGNFELKFLAVNYASANDKVVYLYMRHQFNYFNSQGNPYHESLDSIAYSTGLSRATVTRCILSLESLGWLTKQTTRTKMGHNRTVYKMNDWNRGEQK